MQKIDKMVVFNNIHYFFIVQKVHFYLHILRYITSKTSPVYFVHTVRHNSLVLISAFVFCNDNRLGLGLWCLTPLSTLFQLYRGSCSDNKETAKRNQ